MKNNKKLTLRLERIAVLSFNARLDLEALQNARGGSGNEAYMPDFTESPVYCRRQAIVNG